MEAIVIIFQVQYLKDENSVLHYLNSKNSVSFPSAEREWIMLSTKYVRSWFDGLNVRALDTGRLKVVSE